MTVKNVEIVDNKWAVCQLKDGTWFTANLSEFGYLYKSREACFAERDDSLWDDPEKGFVGYVETLNEEYLIWKSIYEQTDNPYCKKLLRTLKRDLEYQSYSDEKITAD